MDKLENQSFLSLKFKNFRKIIQIINKFGDRLYCQLGCQNHSERL
jgi:hypothetical protein